MVASSGYWTLQYMPFIENMAKKFNSRFSWKFDTDELTSIAIEAALKAERRFDPDRGSFSSYARRFIEGALMRQTSELSPKQQQLINKIYKRLDSYVKEHDAIPNIEVILDELGISQAQYKALPATHPVFTSFVESDALVQDSELLFEVNDAMARLPEKYRDTIYAATQDKRYSKRLYTEGVQMLQELLEVGDNNGK